MTSNKVRGKKKNDIFGLPLVLGIIFVVFLVAIAVLANWAGLQGQLKVALPGDAPSCSNRSVPNAHLNVGVVGREGQTRAQVAAQANQAAYDDLLAAISSSGGGGPEKALADSFCLKYAKDAVKIGKLLCDYPTTPKDDGCMAKPAQPGKPNPYSKARSVQVNKGKAECTDLDPGGGEQWQCIGDAYLGCRGNLLCVTSSPKPCANRTGKFVLWASGMKERRGTPESKVKAAVIEDVQDSIDSQAEKAGVDVPFSQSDVDKACKFGANDKKVNCGNDCWFGYQEGTYTGIMNNLVGKCIKIHVNTGTPSPSGSPLPVQSLCRYSGSVDCNWAGACFQNNPNPSTTPPSTTP